MDEGEEKYSGELWYNLVAAIVISDAEIKPNLHYANAFPSCLRETIARRNCFLKLRLEMGSEIGHAFSLLGVESVS